MSKDSDGVKPFRRSWIQVIREIRAKKVAEIGVCNSLMAATIIRGTRRLKEYWAIDPWSVECASEPSLMKLTVEEWDKLYFDVIKRCEDFGCLRVLRMTSLGAAKQFPDGYFDTVFIDANHAYPAVLEDTEVWKSKIRIGGMLCGHDYHFATVKKAVNKILGSVKVKPGNVWVWERVE